MKEISCDYKKPVSKHVLYKRERERQPPYPNKNFLSVSFYPSMRCFSKRKSRLTKRNRIKFIGVETDKSATGKASITIERDESSVRAELKLFLFSKFHVFFSLSACLCRKLKKKRRINSEKYRKNPNPRFYFWQ